MNETWGNKIIKSCHVCEEIEKSTYKGLGKTHSQKGLRSLEFQDVLMSGAITQKDSSQMPNIQQKVTRHTKKQGEMAYSKEQTKSPETDPKEKQD